MHPPVLCTQSSAPHTAVCSLLIRQVVLQCSTVVEWSSEKSTPFVTVTLSAHADLQKHMYVASVHTRRSIPARPVFSRSTLDDLCMSYTRTLSYTCVLGREDAFHCSCHSKGSDDRTAQNHVTHEKDKPKAASTQRQCTRPPHGAQCGCDCGDCGVQRNHAIQLPHSR
jgi:hypothetical protein